MHEATRTSKSMQRVREEQAPWDPEASPAFWISRVSRALLRRGDGRLRPLGFAMSYLPVMRALAMAARPLSQRELAEAAGVEQLAGRVRDAFDQRVFRLRVRLGELGQRDPDGLAQLPVVAAPIRQMTIV